jgi:hypothetical protein
MSNWLSLIKSIPGLAKAIAELVGDVSHLGSAAARLGAILTMTRKLGTPN